MSESYGESYNPFEDAYTKLAKERNDWLHYHIETFAAAYFKHTNIAPDKAVMCKQLGHDGVERIWFEEKKDNDYMRNGPSS